MKKAQADDQALPIAPFGDVVSMPVTTSGPHPIPINDAVRALTFLPDRTPRTTAEQASGAFTELSRYREGGVFAGHWAGTSEWERHTAGDELVAVIDGATTIIFLCDQVPRAAQLQPGEFVVVPQETWHRFETPDSVTLMSVTPQPTEHSVDELI